AMNDTKIQSLWNKAANDPRLSSQQRQKLAEVGIAPSSEITSALGEMMAGILKEKEEKMWKIEFRGDEIVLGHVGKKILHWLDRFKEIGDIIIQFDPVHAALPWAGFRFLLKLCLEKKGTVDAILIGLEKMASLIDRSNIYILLYLHTNTTASQNLERSILGLFTAILKFVTIAIHRLNDNHLQAVFTTEKISDELREVEELEQTVGHDAAMAEAELQKLLQGVATRKGCERLQQMLNDVTMTMLNLGPQIDAIEKSLEVNRKSKILQWISNIPYTEHHARISEGRLKGTGDWLFEREEYRNWRAISASKLLLLRGIPGAGKTYIASRIIDSFREMPEGKLAYFYCNRAEENRREPRKILSTLIQQLAQTASKEGSKEGLLMPIVDIYRDRERNGQKSAQLSLKESQDLLVQLIDIYPQTTICIDAMDEVDHDTRIHLLKSLKNVIKASKNVVKIFVTTRMDSDILMQFEIFPRIELEPDDNEDDINAFLRTQVQSLIDDGLLLHGEVSKELKEEIYNSLCQRCKGNFQLAALHLSFLRKMQSEKDIKQSLTVLPKTLTLAYDEIYKGILAQEGSASQMALNAFRWIQYSMEPLSSETLLDAITVEIDSSGGFSQTGPATKKQLLTVC
ncbi:hypothetical protein L211DRAFT_769603, partial [Terfezia boudieri ATCC MYA-4762]